MADERWVSQSEAARLLGVAQSSISRFIAANSDVPVKRSGRGNVETVEFNALTLARGGSLAVQDKVAEREAVNTKTAPGVRGGEEPVRRNMRDEVLALDLAERKGEVLARASVQSAVEGAGLAFVQALERRRRQLASKLAEMSDLRAVELELKASDRLLMEALVRDLTRAAAGLELAVDDLADEPADESLVQA
jgi:hypothetical protein